VKVKVIFVKDDYTTIHAEQVVDTGDGWSLATSVPLPAPTPTAVSERHPHRFPVRPADGEPYPRVALVFVEEGAETIELDVAGRERVAFNAVKRLTDH
jgi:hypothetical protein